MERAELRPFGWLSEDGREFVKRETYRHPSGFNQTALYYREGGILYREDLGFPDTRQAVA